MLVTVGGASLIPLVIKWASGEESPFLLNAAWRFGVALGCLTILAVFFGGFVRDERSVLWQNRNRLRAWAVAGTIVGNLDYAFFSLSLRFIDIALATVLIETYPIIIVFLLAFLYRKEQGSRRKVGGPIVLLLACFVGFFFLSASEAGGFDAIFAGSGAGPSDIPIGILLALTGAITVSCTTFTFKWCEDVSRDIAPEIQTTISQQRLTLCCLIIALTFANAVSVPVNAVVGLAKGETISLQSLAIGIFIGGTLIQAIPSIAWRAANLVTHNLGINAMLYLVPIVSLLWLWVFSHIGVARLDYYIIGIAGIFTANLLINFEAERLFSFKALVIALWACGTVVYLRSFNQGIWVGGDYFNALAVSSTVFILILSFRVARLSTRILDEDNRAFHLVRELDSLARRGLIGPEVCEYVLTIDEAEGPKLQEAYNEARQSIVVALRGASPGDWDKLITLEAELDSLTHSRQQGINFGELSALTIFAGLILSLTLFSRPDVSGMTAFLIEMFSILFASVIIFLTFGIGDLQRDRIARIMLSRSVSRSGEYEVIFQDQTRRHIEQAITVVVSLLIVVAYAGLLGHKWLGWFG